LPKSTSLGTTNEMQKRASAQQCIPLVVLWVLANRADVLLCFLLVSSTLTSLRMSY
jgi:hypothetical protein